MHPKYAPIMFGILMAVFGLILKLMAYSDVTAWFDIPARLALLMASAIFPFVVAANLKHDPALDTVTSQGISGYRAKIFFSFLTCIVIWAVLLLGSGKLNQTYHGSNAFDLNILAGVTCAFIIAGLPLRLAYIIYDKAAL